MIQIPAGAPLLVLGLLVVLAIVFGDRVKRADIGLVGTFLSSPIHPASWLATVAIVLGFAVELVAFTLLISALSTGGSLLIIGVGVVFIGLGIEISRLYARVERWRATLADPRPLLAHPYRPYGGGLRHLLLAVFADGNRWRDVVYVVIALPLAIIEFVVVVVLWSLAIGLVSVPVWYVAVGEPSSLSWTTVEPSAIATVAGLVGLVLLPVAATVSRGLMALHRAVIAGLLCESEETRLEHRVATLEDSRQAVIAAEARELHRIERDLHDGAQQRLVSVAMSLGLAAERLESDPSSARELVVEAQEQARLALREIRDLVRGIAPPILLDRGLVAALSALAARSSVPTAVLSTLPTDVRPPEAVERAAYFVVAEALTNVAKHASATRCEIRCRPEPRALVVEVWDDGSGGAGVVSDGGLAGLAGRVEALDGSLSIDSPSGGPTLVRATLPVPSVRAVTSGVVATGPTADPAPSPPAAPLPSYDSR
jgi:signal transduction histidine kinase